MKQLVLKSFIIGSTVIITVFIFLFSYGDKSIDPFYRRFTTKAQSSLIIGTSRAAQGIVPGVINAQKEEALYNLPIFNYAFTVSHSSFNEAYLKSIKRKLKASSKNGLFIISVDPWALAEERQEMKKTLYLEGNDSFIQGVHLVNVKPNIEYLTKFFGPLYHLISAEDNKYLHLHNDGWLEVNISMDAEKVAKRKQNKVIQYIEYAKNLHLSEKRFEILKSTISFLKEQGEVFLVRLPVSNEMANIENTYFPGFKSKITNFALEREVAYLDMFYMNKFVATTDGNHLHKSDAVKVTEKLATLIKNELLVSIPIEE